jgi:hypothetical protein
LLDKSETKSTTYIFNAPSRDEYFKNVVGRNGGVVGWVAGGPEKANLPRLLRLTGIRFGARNFVGLIFRMCHITNKTLGEVEVLSNLYGIFFALNRLLQCGFNATMNTTMIPDTYLLPPPQPTIGARFLGHKFGGLVALPTAFEVAECLFAAGDDMHKVPTGVGAIVAQLQTPRPAFRSCAG